jgi:hypothetical protein
MIFNHRWTQMNSTKKLNRLVKRSEKKLNGSGHIVKRGKLKMWTGTVPLTPIEKAIEQLRRNHHA